MSDIAQRRATLADVATRAGVSKSTVSKALNGRDDISAATHARVMTAVSELGYRSTTAPMVTRSRQAIAVVFDLPASPYILGVLQGSITATSSSHIDLLARLAPALAVREEKSIARDWIAEQKEAGIAGIIGLTLSRASALIDAANSAGVPFVMVDPIDADNGMVSVGSSNWAGARTATEYLIGLGHTRIAWIGGPQTSSAARDRLYGYQAALDAAGLGVDPALIRAGHFAVDSGAQEARALLASTNPPTAIMGANDEIAVGVLATAHALGIRVPEELSITGFDDTPQAAWTSPALTTVHQNLEGMGSIAVQTMLNMTAGRQPSSRHVELATSMTLRESTASPPAAR
jgi:LacI family transcriptional regulator